MVIILRTRFRSEEVRRGSQRFAEVRLPRFLRGPPRLLNLFVKNNKSMNLFIFAFFVLFFGLFLFRFYQILTIHSKSSKTLPQQPLILPHQQRRDLLTNNHLMIHLQQLIKHAISKLQTPIKLIQNLLDLLNLLNILLRPFICFT